ncbi:MAG TPA: carboxypeptidase M32, partial [Candidatus Bathyarchaeia archaeon]|nr:carboxypeptidase M32 [Candidatus Bathyarchaeia archaeon]
MSNIPVIQEIVESYKPIWALNHAASIFGWDLETYMPHEAAHSRGFAQAQITLMRQQRVLSLAKTISKAQKLGNLNDYENGIVRTISRELNYFVKVPPNLIEELQRTETEATVVWREARRKSDFSLFQPYLEKIIELKKREADKLGFEGHRYNALLDIFEEGLTTKDVD